MSSITTERPVPTEGRIPTERPIPTWPARIGWAAHLLLRIVLAAALLIYGWAKVFLIQMGMADFGDALVGYGEMSPMGLLWRMVGFSVAFQVLSGVAELLAAVLLLWRRAAGIGAVVAAFDMFFVFLLNLSYDVPVKELSLALAIGATVAALPYVTRFLRATFTAGPIPRGPLPTVVTGRAGKVVTAIGLVLALAMVIGSAVLSRLEFPAPTAGPAIAGVYRVTGDKTEPAATLAEDPRWQQLAIGQWSYGDQFRFSIRQANGDLRTGYGRTTGPDTIELGLRPPQRGAVRTTQPAEQTISLRWSRQPDGLLRVAGAGQELELAPDPEFRFLFDRDFSWAARLPVNR